MYLPNMEHIYRLKVLYTQTSLLSIHDVRFKIEKKTQQKIYIASASYQLFMLHFKDKKNPHTKLTMFFHTLSGEEVW